MFFGMLSQYPIYVGGSGSEDKSSLPMMSISNGNNNVTIHPDKLLVQG
mgnify:CR=1 FL=1|jgi:hypothetical protein